MKGKKDKEEIELEPIGSIDFSYNQLVQLVKIAESLPRDQQKMLVQVLSDKVQSPKQQHLNKGATKSPQRNYEPLY